MAASEPKLVMALKVRDEEDILDHNLRYHRAQGVDFFIVTDNGSTDRTPEILRRWAEAGLAKVIEEPGDDLAQNGHEWITRMAREAATEHGADWVIHGDADEFWWPLQGSIKDALGAIPPEFGVVIGPRTEFVARPDGPGEFYERLTLRTTRFLLRPKVAHRAYPDVFVLHEGQHDVTIGADLPDAFERVRPPGRPVLRAVREEAASGEDFRLVWAPRFPLEIFHFPIRSLAQYRLRVEVLLANPAFANPDMIGRLNVARKRDNLEDFYAGLLPDEAQIEREIAAGDLVRDDRVMRFMKEISGEFAAGPRPVSGAERTPEEIEAERAALEVDAMHVLARTERMLMIRNDHRNRLRRATRTTPKRRPLRRRLRILAGRLLGRGPGPVEAGETAENGDAEGGDADRDA
jgi:glycosyl transferase family 2